MRKPLIIIPIIAAAIAIAAGIKLGRSRTPALSSDSTTSPALIESPLPQVAGDAKDERSEAWKIFERYLAAAKKHDIATVKALSYQVSAACSDPAKTSDCNDLMDNAYNFGSGFKEAELTHAAGDDKQLILTSEYFVNSTDGSFSITRGELYFVRENGELKFLSLKPFNGAVIMRSSDMSTSTAETRLRELVKDADQDGLPDQTELCKDTTALPDCIPTDPKKKDTDGDGWWDSIEALFYK